MTDGQDAPIPLSYARPRQPADEANTALAADVLLRGGAMSEFVACFRRTRDAAFFYVTFFATRFARGDVDGVCVGCGRQCDDVVAVLWQQLIPLRTFEFAISENAQVVRFETFHAMCDGCLGITLRRMRLARRWMGFGAAVWALGVASLVWGATSSPSAKAWREAVGNFSVTPPFLLLLAGIIIVGTRERVRARPLPGRLRELTPGSMISVRPATQG